MTSFRSSNRGVWSVLVLSSTIGLICIVSLMCVHSEVQQYREEVEHFRGEMLKLMKASKMNRSDENVEQQQYSASTSSSSSSIDINSSDIYYNTTYDNDNTKKNTNRVLCNGGIELELEEVDVANPGSRRRFLCGDDTHSKVPESFTFASLHGLVGDAVTDDTLALQAAIDAASNNDSGGTVVLPKGTFLTSAPLLIPAGVTLKGQGYGSSPLAIKFGKAGGSTVAYCGEDYAVKIQGHSTSLQDLAIYDWRYPIGSDCDNYKAKGGVLLDADGKLVESVTMNNVLIYWFMGGTSLTLRSVNKGGIAYGNFQNLRIRHAHTGILLEAEHESFTNSNTFVAGAISGSILEAGIIARGPGACNDNKFWGTVIEPRDTNLAHVYVTGSSTNVRMTEVRLEGTEMGIAGEDGTNKPLIVIDDSSYGNVMTGMLGHTHVQADRNRNPGLDFISSKTVGLDPVPFNHFWNAAFQLYDLETRTLPGWDISGSLDNSDIIVNVTVLQTPVLFPNHNILSIEYNSTANNGETFKLTSDNTIPAAPAHSFVTFGVYARSSTVGTISAAMRYKSGSIIASTTHSGSGEWEFIGMTALYDQTNPYFYFSIKQSVELSAPSFIYGHTPAIPGASLLSGSGARMSGTLSMGMVVSTVKSKEDCLRWVLPRGGGNIFRMELTGGDITSCTIQRINDSTADRFPHGTVITLMFPAVGITIQNGGYLKLRDGQNFSSSVHSSLTLVTSGGASWTEIGRNA